VAAPVIAASRQHQRADVDETTGGGWLRQAFGRGVTVGLRLWDRRDQDGLKDCLIVVVNQVE
jgi:hypothetical protein